MLTLVESGEYTWAVGAANGMLHVYGREEDGTWFELPVGDDQTDLAEDAMTVLESVYEEQASNGHLQLAQHNGQPEASEQDERDEQDEEDEDEPEEDEEPEEEEAPKRGRGRSTTSRAKTKRK